MNTETVARLLGTCPICEGTYKVRQGAIVHHGFKRPGDGMIHGDCFAVGHPPYEVSCEITRIYRLQLLGQRADVETTLAPFKAGTVVRFVDAHIVRRGWESRLVETEYVLGVTEPYTWSRGHDARVRELEFRIRMLDSEIRRLARLIDGWEPRDIRTVMEEKARNEKAARAERAAVVQAKRDEKARKAAELKARRDARAARLALK